MSVTVEGFDKLVQNLSRIEKQLVKAIATGAQMTQAQMVNHARANHGADAHSQRRFISHHGGTGLVGSIQPGQIVITDAEVTAEVVARASYAQYVEKGVPGRNRAYPFLEPARKAMQKPLVQNVKRMMKQALG